LFEASLHETLKLYFPGVTIVVVVFKGIIISVIFISCCLTPGLKLVGDFVKLNGTKAGTTFKKKPPDTTLVTEIS